MRLSTSQIYDSSTRGMQRNQFDLFKLQNQLSTGRKVLTPEDDPIAAAQALVLTQSKEVSGQYLSNQDDARGKLGIVEGQLSSLGDLLQNVRERLVQAGNTTLSNSDRSYIAQELEARFSELMGIANAGDGSGNYLFSGYQGATKPFDQTAAGAEYQGDEGRRLLQVESSRQLPISISGSELFEKVRNGNGTFSTETIGNVLANAGNATVTSTVYTDISPALPGTQWSAATAPWSNASNQSIQVQFSVDATTGNTQYQLFDISNPANPVAMRQAPADYTSGAPIALKYYDANALPLPVDHDLGASITLTGAPVVGDSFSIVPDANPANGFVTTATGNRLSPTTNNTGTGIIDTGSVTNYGVWNSSLANQSLWADPLNAGKMQVQFSVNATTGKTQYQLFDVSAQNSPATPMTAIPQDYVSGQKIDLSYGSTSLGAFVSITGAPVAGDTFAVSPSVNQSIFTTLRSAIDTLTRGVGGENSPTQFTNELGNHLLNIDQSLENVSKMRSTVGTSLRELDSLTNTGEDQQLQYSSALSELQDLDYAEAITELSKKKMQLEAVQLSFKQTSQLSLFSIL